MTAKRWACLEGLAKDEQIEHLCYLLEELVQPPVEFEEELRGLNGQRRAILSLLLHRMGTTVPHAALSAAAGAYSRGREPLDGDDLKVQICGARRWLRENNKSIKIVLDWGRGYIAERR